MLVGCLGPCHLGSSRRRMLRCGRWWLSKPLWSRRCGWSGGLSTDS